MWAFIFAFISYYSAGDSHIPMETPVRMNQPVETHDETLIAEELYTQCKPNLRLPCIYATSQL